jgi:hypothetical protein
MKVLPAVGGKVVSTVEELAKFIEDSGKNYFNDHNSGHLWIFIRPIVSFLRLKHPSECLLVLEDLRERSGDFTVRFEFGYGCGSIFLHLLSGVLYDMRQTSLELVTEEKLKDWRRVAKELIDHGFTVVFLLEKIHMVAQMYFGKRASAEAKAIDTQISYDKEHIAQLEARTGGLPLVWATHFLEALSHTRSFLLFLVLLRTIYIGL